jgi:hypothetical protein
LSVIFSRLETFEVDDICYICGDPVDQDNLAHHVNELYHIFHENCVLPWLEKDGGCPTCRAEVRARKGITSLT